MTGEKKIFTLPITYKNFNEKLEHFPNATADAASERGNATAFSYIRTGGLKKED